MQVELNEPEHTADLTIHLREIAGQRVVFSGGRGQFGSTLGTAYTIGLLNRDELLSAQIDSGPESLQMALGLAKEGFLGSRGSLALSVFDTFLRPHLAGSVQGPFFRTQAKGVNVGWNYSLSNVDAFSITGATASTLRSEFSNQPIHTFLIPRFGCHPIF